MNKKMLVLYGLKWNPFAPDVPVEALWPPEGHTEPSDGGQGGSNRGERDDATGLPGVRLSR
jgi:hypothetical protein